jgi:hypothetical protein
MGINEFDEFPLPVPPLDDDPFASLSVADIAAMEAAPDDDEDGSNSEYEDDEEGDETTTSDLFNTELLLFPFWCLDAKGGGESIYLVIYHFLFGFGL